jgi:tripartite-type tricarboxylate transporter receptor subunit TctC
MAKTLGQAIIIENVPGAGGTTATIRTARATADGYTLMVGHMGTHGAAPAAYPNLKYDPAKDFTPIGLTAGVPAVIVTRKDFPANTLREFVDYLKSNQGKVNEAHGGVGAQMHTLCTLLQSIIGTKTGRVAYRTVYPAARLAGFAMGDCTCIGLNGVVSQIQGARSRPSQLPAPRART